MFELPIGLNKLLFGNASGWVARASERWQTSFIVNFSTGGPSSLTAGSMLYRNGVADVVGPFNLRQGDVEWGAPDHGSSIPVAFTNYPNGVGRILPNTSRSLYVRRARNIKTTAFAFR